MNFIVDEFEVAGAEEWQVDKSPQAPRRSGNSTHGERPTEVPLVDISNDRQNITENARPESQPEAQSAVIGRDTSSTPGPASTRAPVWIGRQRQNVGNERPGNNVINPGNNPNISLAEAAYRARQPRSGIIPLSIAYGRLAQSFAATNNGNAPFIKRDAALLVNHINKTSGAFIPLPDNRDHVLSVWGTPEQISKARHMLDSMSKTPQRSEKSMRFAKTLAYSERREARLNFQEQHGSVLQVLRGKPDPSIEFPHTMIFLWPTDELPFDSCLGPNLEAFDNLRQEFSCHIYIYEGDSTYIRVDGMVHATVVTIAQRIRAKCAELMATMHIKVKMYLIQPPQTQVMRTQVGVVKIPESAMQIRSSIPVLSGAPLQRGQLAAWADKRESLSTKNEKRLREAVERSLSGLRFLRGHLRMRVNFGTFVLDDYRVPKDQNDRYSFEEFRGMLFHPRTKGHLIPGLEFESSNGDLVSRCAAASNVLSPSEPTVQSLLEAKPSYAVNFEFEGGNDGLLRLEAEFSKSPRGLFEVSQSRWIKPQADDKLGDRRPPLHIGVLDFERSDWQLEIKALEFHDASNVEQALKTFSYKIGFEPGEGDGLRGIGHRRVTFPDTVPISRLVEKTALRYRLKGTNYIFELARYDAYNRVNAPGFYSNQMAEEPVTSWGASIFDLQWDNMLGKHADFRVGHTAEWAPSLNTFFPSIGDTNSNDPRTGFTQFINLVNQVAELMSPEDKARPKILKPDTAKPALNTKTNKTNPSGVRVGQLRREVENAGPSTSSPLRSTSNMPIRNSGPSLL